MGEESRKLRVETAEHGKKTCFPIVGIGASAGGLVALQQLFENMPAETGMAFVVVQHLPPHHSSALRDILADTASMPVYEVKDPTPVVPNSIFIITPGMDLVIADKALLTVPRAETPHMPINTFFRSLAQSEGSNAIGVVLSGTGTDGTLGLQAIKGEEGLTFAQDSASATFSQMPFSAVASGCVDFILGPPDIAKELTRISRHPYSVQYDQNAQEEPPAPSGEGDLGPILRLLSESSKVDLAHYKQNTLRRRIFRRMLLQKIDSLDDYIAHLKVTPAELSGLFNDLLINVTSFFRDPDAFQALRDVISSDLLKNRPEHSPIRIWVPGCSTGEEVYSIAICLLELLGDASTNANVQIFATDISQKAIETARAGIYTGNTLRDTVSEERLRRFFAKVDRGYQISEQIRKLCVFAVQNVTADPPFSKMDLISCRNLLIYLGPTLQKRVINVLHYALKDTGYLFLGSSESIGAFPELFSIKDKKHNIYSKIQTTAWPHPLAFAEALFPGRPSRNDNTATFYDGQGMDVGLEAQKEAERIILKEYAPCGVLINENSDIIQFRGDTAMYLTPAPGRASFNLLTMAREGLEAPLQTLIAKAKKEGQPAKKEGIRLDSNGKTKKVCIEVVPIKTSQDSPKHLLVLFRDLGQKPPRKERPKADAERLQKLSPKEKDEKILELEYRLADTEERLKDVRESLRESVAAHEASKEELKTTTEEILSANEEMQSTNEELETSREELTSTNEELNTVNEELQSRNTQLARANSDLNNLLASVRIAIVMLGGDLRLRRFNPSAQKLLKFIPADVGRPITDIMPHIVIPSLQELVSNVIHTAIPKELDIQDYEGHWYSVRIQPYKTSENKIDGVVLAAIDIQALKQAERKFSGLLEAAPDAMVILNEEGKIVLVNAQAEKLFGYSRQELLGQLVEILIPERYRKRHPEFRARFLKEGRPRPMGIGLELFGLHKDGTEFPVEISLSTIQTAEGTLLSSAIRDISKRK